MTIAHAHKLLDQELLTVPEALLGQHQDVRQALVSLVGTVDVVILDGSTLFSSEWFSATRSGTSSRKQAQRFIGSVRAEADRIVNIQELASMTDGCSGAEIAGICQDAALNAMNVDIEIEAVGRRHLVEAAKSIRRRITSEVVQGYEEWRDRSGIRSA